MNTRNLRPTNFINRFTWKKIIQEVALTSFPSLKQKSWYVNLKSSLRLRVLWLVFSVSRSGRVAHLNKNFLTSDVKRWQIILNSDWITASHCLENKRNFKTRVLGLCAKEKNRHDWTQSPKEKQFVKSTFFLERPVRTRLKKMKSISSVNDVSRFYDSERSWEKCKL